MKYIIIHNLINNIKCIYIQIKLGLVFFKNTCFPKVLIISKEYYYYNYICIHLYCNLRNLLHHDINRQRWKLARKSFASCCKSHYSLSQMAKFYAM